MSGPARPSCRRLAICVLPAACAGLYCTINIKEMYASRWQWEDMLWVQVELAQAYSDITRVILW